MNKRQRKKNRKRDNLFTRLMPRCKWRKRYVLDNARFFRSIDISDKGLSFSEESVVNDRIIIGELCSLPTIDETPRPLGERWSRGFKKKPRRLRYGG